jgi:hypothetical protein
MFVTVPVFHPDMSLLKFVALRNIYDMSVTAPVFHPDMSPLKAVAELNIFAMFSTDSVFHPDMFPLKAVALLNIYDTFVTVDGNVAGTDNRFTAPSQAYDRSSIGAEPH